MIIFGIFGLILISYGLWVKSEVRQDAVFVIGGFSLLLYSIYLGDVIFVVLQMIFIISAVAEIYKLKK